MPPSPFLLPPPTPPPPRPPPPRVPSPLWLRRPPRERQPRRAWPPRNWHRRDVVAPDLSVGRSGSRGTYSGRGDDGVGGDGQQRQWRRCGHCPSAGVGGAADGRQAKVSIARAFQPGTDCHPSGCGDQSATYGTGSLPSSPRGVVCGQERSDHRWRRKWEVVTPPHSTDGLVHEYQVVRHNNPPAAAAFTR